MGRKKLEIKRIENKSSCQVAFSKRRNGLIKKAREISILCDVEVALIIYSARGRRYDFCSANSLSTVIDRYWNQQVQDAGKHKSAAETKSNQEHPLALGKLLETFKSQLEEPHIDQLGVTDLVQLETRIDAALHRVKLQKTHLLMDSISALKNKENDLMAENEVLGRKVLHQKKKENPGKMTIQFL